MGQNITKMIILLHVYEQFKFSRLSPVQFRSKPLKPNFVSIYFDDFIAIIDVAQRRHKRQNRAVFAPKTAKTRGVPGFS